MKTQLQSTYQYQPGGSLPPEASTYVIRQADIDLFQSLLVGEYCYVLNSRQMGKSSLRIQTMERLRNQGIACTEIELSGIGSQQITAAQWYGGIIQELISGFALPVNRRQWLCDHDDLSPVQQLGEFIEQVLLTQISQSLVIFIDEIDSVLGLSFPTDEFFALIRHCYEKRAYHSTYQRLSFVLLGVATPGDLIRDEHATPFNIGRSIELKGFQLQESMALAKGMVEKAEQPQVVLQEILHWTGGQPFLTQKLCWLVTTTDTYIAAGEEARKVDRLVRSHLLENWETQDEPEHLRTIRDRILRNSRYRRHLLQLYRQVLRQGQITDTTSAESFELRLTGLVTKQNGSLQVYNRIYAAIFNLSWVQEELAPPRLPSPPLSHWNTLFLSLVTGACICGLRTSGVLQGAELAAFDQLMQLRPAEPADERIVAITVSEADIQYQDNQRWQRRGSLSDRALLLLLQKLEPHQPSTIAIDIYHDFEFEPYLASKLAYHQRFIAACELGHTLEVADPISIAAPPNISTQQIGFTDFPVDPRYVIRRQLFGATATSECPSNYSLSLRVALAYLKQQGIASVQKTVTGAVQIGDVIFPRLVHNAGGYQLSPQEAAGYQLLINYRAADPLQIPLTRILDGSLDNQLSDLVRDRILFIGVADPKDSHFTPYSQGTIPNRMLGVLVHAQMTSQIISAVQDDRPLIWWLPEWGEVLWVVNWAVMGGILTWQGYAVKRSLRVSLLLLGFKVGAALGMLYGLCFCFLLLGGWLPLVPAAIAFLVTNGGIMVYQTYDRLQ